MTHIAEWVCRDHEVDVPRWLLPAFLHFSEHSHWSRSVEYPWTVLNGGFQKGQMILDAAGGGADFGKVIGRYFQSFVVNLDINPNSFQDQSSRNVAGDLRRIPFADDSFDRVMCISAMEHVEQPLTSLKEMWRVLKINGRLILTIDVSSIKVKNFHVDCAILLNILQFLDIPWPDPQNSKVAELRDDKVPFYLRSLCIAKIKV